MSDSDGGKKTSNFKYLRDNGELIYDAIDYLHSLFKGYTDDNEKGELFLLDKDGNRHQLPPELLKDKTFSSYKGHYDSDKHFHACGGMVSRGLDDQGNKKQELEPKKPKYKEWNLARKKHDFNAKDMKPLFTHGEGGYPSYFTYGIETGKPFLNEEGFIGFHIVIDIDDAKINEIFERSNLPYKDGISDKKRILPPTFSVRSGSKKLLHLHYHLLLHSSLMDVGLMYDSFIKQCFKGVMFKGFKVDKSGKDNTRLMDVQGAIQQVIGPGAYYDKGKKVYEIVKNGDDDDEFAFKKIASITLEQLVTAILSLNDLDDSLQVNIARLRSNYPFFSQKYLSEKKIYENNPRKYVFNNELIDIESFYEDGGRERIDEEAEKIKATVNMTELVEGLLREKHGDDRYAGRNPTMCPLGTHESDGEACFSYSDDKKLFYCFHCQEGGTVFKLIMLFYSLNYKYAKNKIAIQTGVSTLKDVIIAMYESENKADRVIAYGMIAKHLRENYNYYMLYEDGSSTVTAHRYFCLQRKQYVDYGEELKERVYGATLGFNRISPYVASIIERQLKVLALKHMDNFLDEYEMPSEFIPLNDFLYDPIGDRFLEYTKDYYVALHRLDVNFDKEVCNGGNDCGHYIKKKIRETVWDDCDMDKMQEWVGYNLYKGNPYKKMMILHGRRGDNGKSLVTGILNLLLNPKNVANVSLDELMTKDFAMSNLAGKMANIAQELSAESMKKTEVIKKLTGGSSDKMQVNAKNKPYVYLDADFKLTFTTNTLPVIDEKTHSLYKRILLIDFPYVFTSNPDPKDKFQRQLETGIESLFLDTPAERSCIFNWACEGLVRLLNNNGNFTMSTLEKQLSKGGLQKGYGRLSVPYNAFVNDWFILTNDETDIVTFSDVDYMYLKYCDIYGLTPAIGNKMAVHRRRYFTRLGAIKGEDVDTDTGKRTNIYQKVMVIAEAYNEMQEYDEQGTTQEAINYRDLENKNENKNKGKEKSGDDDDEGDDVLLRYKKSGGDDDDDKGDKGVSQISDKKKTVNGESEHQQSVSDITARAEVESIEELNENDNTDATEVAVLGVRKDYDDLVSKFLTQEKYKGEYKNFLINNYETLNKDQCDHLCVLHKLLTGEIIEIDELSVAISEGKKENNSGIDKSLIKLQGYRGSNTLIYRRRLNEGELLGKTKEFKYFKLENYEDSFDKEHLKKIAVIDLECDDLDTTKAKIVLFCIYSFKHHEYRIYTYDYSDASKNTDLFRYLSEHKVWAGYNTINYDIPVLMNRKNQAMVPYMFAHLFENKLDVDMALAFFNNKNNIGYSYRMPRFKNIIHIDLYRVLFDPNDKNRGKSKILEVPSGKILWKAYYGKDSLANVAKAFEVPLPKGEIDYKIFTEFDTRDKIQGKNSESDIYRLKEAVEYGIRDIQITTDSLLYVLNFFRPFTLEGVAPKSLIENYGYITEKTGTIAYKIICDKLGVYPKFRHDKQEIAFFKEQQKKYGIIGDKEKDTFQGGVVFNNSLTVSKRGDGVVDDRKIYAVDFTSLYPLTIIGGNLSSPKGIKLKDSQEVDWIITTEDKEGETWDGGELFRDVVKGVYEARDGHEGKIEKVTYEMFKERLTYKEKGDSRQFPLKIIVNGAYGATGNPVFEMIYSLTTAPDCTAIARKMLEITRQMFEDNGFIPIYGATDSCFVVAKQKDGPLDNRESVQRVCDKIVKKITSNMPYSVPEFALVMDPTIDFAYFYVKDGVAMKNNYCYTNVKGKVKFKGWGAIKKDAPLVAVKIINDIITPNMSTENKSERRVLYTEKEMKKYVHDIIEQEGIGITGNWYEVKAVKAYKSDKGIRAKLSKRYGIGKHLIISLSLTKKAIKYYNLPGAYCSVDEFQKLGFRVENINTDKIMKVLSPFIKKEGTRRLS